MASETNVGTIAVDIVARMDGLERNMTRAGKEFAGFGGMVAGATAAVASFAIETGKAAAGALVNFTKETFNAIDAQSKFATSIGADIGALRGLLYAGDLAGASAEDMNTAFKKMNKTIGDGINGEKAATDALTKLGLNIFELAGMRGDEQFKAIAEAIAKIPLETQRTAAAMDVFGKGAMTLLPLITSDINAATKEFESFGGAISKVDAQKVEAANDAITKVKTSLKVTLESVIVQLAPGIEKIANAFLKMGISGEHAIDNISNAYKKLLPYLKILSPQLFLESSDFGMGGVSSTKLNAPAAGPAAPTLAQNQEVWRKQIADKKKAEIDAAEEVKKRETAAADAYWRSEDEKIKKSFALYTSEAQKEIDALQARRDKAFQEHGTKKKTENKTMRSIGFGGALEAGGVSAEALRQASRQVQVVSDPQLTVTNATLAKIERKIGTGGTAVTV